MVGESRAMGFDFDFLTENLGSKDSILFDKITSNGGYRLDKEWNGMES